MKDAMGSALRPNVFAGPGYHEPILTDDRDALPHDRAVWREGRPGGVYPADKPVSIDYRDTVGITLARIGKVDWTRVDRWRFGWPPLRDR